MKNNDHRPLQSVALIGLLMMLVFGVIAIIGDPFEYDQMGDKPTLVVVALLLVATALSVLAIRRGLHVVDTRRRLFWLILSLGIGFRAVMVLTPPILEADYYRYLWDGKVVQAGVSPYRYSPQTIIDTGLTQTPETIEDENLKALADLAHSASNHEILSRVHYSELTTIYPPTSQLVFWSVARIVPTESSVWLHVLIIRAAFMLFDVGTIVLLVMLLSKLDRHPAWLIAYAWNPLVIKEIANSGHLDSLAVFLMVSAALFLLKARSGHSQSNALGSGMALGLAVGAKLFPVILVPAFVAKLTVSGWKIVTIFCAAFFVTCLVVLYPMSASLLPKARLALSDISTVSKHGSESIQAGSTDPDGLTEFISTWRMNDAIFSSIYFNLKPRGTTAESYWYVVTPNKLREQVAQLQNRGFFGANPAFVLTRLITLSIFAIVYLAIMRRFTQDTDERFLDGILIVLFSFLMLQPTINPWYWVWVVPFTCFKSRWCWPAISGVLLIYYTRFFFEESSLELEFLHRTYRGAQIFDHFVVWIELILIVIFATLAGRLDVERSANRPVQ